MGQLSFDDLVATYINAYEAALTQNGRFLFPKPVFVGVTHPVHLLREVEIICPIVWYAEKKQSLSEWDRDRLRACYASMRDEANTLIQAEFLAEFGCNDDLNAIKATLTKAKKLKYTTHPSIKALDNRRLALTN